MDVIVSRIVQVIILVPAVVMLAVWAVACIRPVLDRRRGCHELAPPHPRHLPIRGGRR